MRLLFYRFPFAVQSAEQLHVLPEQMIGFGDTEKGQ